MSCRSPYRENQRKTKITSHFVIYFYHLDFFFHFYVCFFVKTQKLSYCSGSLYQANKNITFLALHVYYLYITHIMKEWQRMSKKKSTLLPAISLRSLETDIVLTWQRWIYKALHIDNMDFLKIKPQKENVVLVLRLGKSKSRHLTNKVRNSFFI